MILIEWTVDGVMTRISTEDIVLTHQWYGYVSSISSIKFQTTKKYGGYAKPSFSDFSLIPKLFENSWPPPKQATVKLTQASQTESDGVVIFDGTSQRSKYDRHTVKYELKQHVYDAKITKGTAYSGTLGDVIDTLCGIAGLNLTVDHTEERVVMPTVSYTTTSDIQAIDLLSDMCAFFTHGFKIVTGVVYIYDMLTPTTPVALTEFDVMPCSYKDEEPISLITLGDDSVVGSNTNGEEISISTRYCTTGIDTVTALGNIKIMLENDVATIKCKVDVSKPTILEYISLTDESTIGATITSARVTSIIYNFDSLDMEISARGSVT